MKEHGSPLEEKRFLGKRSIGDVCIQILAAFCSVSAAGL